MLTFVLDYKQDGAIRILVS